VTAVLINAALGSSVAQATPADFTLNFATSTGTPGVGDLIVVCVTIRGTAGTVSTPSGWTAMSGSPFQYTSNASRMYLFYRVRAAGDASSVSFTVTGGVTNNTLLAQAYYFGGVDPANPIEVNPVKTDQASSSTTVAASAVTTTNANALGVAFYHRADDAGTWAAGNSWTANNATNARPASTLGTDASMGMATKEMPTAGGTLAPTLTVTSGVAAVGMSVVLALKAQTGSGLVTMDAEGGTDEVTPTAQSTATPTIAIVVGTGTTVVDTAFAATHSGGTKSFRHDISTTTQGRVKCNADIPSTRQYGAFIGRVGSRPSGAAIRMASVEAYDGTDLAQVQMNPSGQIRLASDGAANTLGPSTTAFDANEEFRVEWLFNAGAVELRIFKGADLGDDVSTPTETLSTTGWPTGTVGRGMFGNGTAWGVATSLWYDNCSIREDTWVNLKASSTTAAAGSASATVSGQTASKAVRPSAGAASATVSGQAPSKQVTVNAGVASLGVAAQAATAVTAGGGTTAVAGAATLGVAAQPATVTRTGEPDATAATLTITGHAPTGLVRPTAGAAALSVTGQAATGRVTASAQAAALGVVANAATTTRTGEPDAQTATVGVVAHAPTRLVATNASAAAGTVAGQNPQGQVRASAGLASITATANAATATLTGEPDAATATLTVTAHAPTGLVRPTAGAATFGMAGQNATASTSAATTATAGAATLGIAGQAATGRTTVVAPATAATLSVAAQQPAVARTGEPDAGTATATVAGQNAQPSVQASAQAATVGVVAHAPTTLRAGRPLPTAATASIAGQNAQAQVTATAGAAALGVAGQNATKTVAPSPIGKPQQWPNGYLADGTGWGGTAYDSGTTYNGHGTYRADAGATAITGPWFSPIEPGRIYRASAVMKSDVAAGNMYWGLQYRDRDTFALGPSTNYVPNLNTLTTLAADLKNGDTTVTVTDASQWSAAAGRYFAVWGHSDSAGTKWRPNTYTRLIATMASPYVTGNVITLNAAWSGGTVRAGTPVGQTVSAGSYLYFGNIGGTPPLDWTRHEVTIDGTSPDGVWNNPTKIPHGGYEVRFIGLNLSNPTGQFWVAEAELLEVGPPTSVLVSWAPKASIVPSGVESAAATVTALNATVSTATNTTATAQAATLGVVAQTGQGRVTATAQAAAITVTGHAPTAARTGEPDAQAATATVTGQNAQGQVRATAGAATPSVAGLNATVSTSGATVAPAATATVTVAGQDGQGTVRASAQAATLGVAAQPGQGRPTATAGAGSLAFTAHAPTGRAAVVAPAQSASIAVSAQNPTASRTGEPDATTAAVTITGHAPTTLVRPTATAGSSTIAGQPAQGQVRASAGQAALSVSAQQASVSTANQTFAQAGAAALGVTAHAPTITATGNALPTTATVGVTSHAPSRAVTPRGGQAAGAVAANAGQGQVRANAGAAALTATAHAPTVAVSGNTTVTPTAATLAVTGQPATVSTSADAVANAGTASIGMTSGAPKPSLRPVAAVALAAAAAQQANATLRTSAGAAAATVTGQAPKPVLNVRPSAGTFGMTAHTLRGQIALTAQYAAAAFLAQNPNTISERFVVRVTVPTSLYRFLVDDFVSGPASTERRVVAATVDPTNSSGEPAMRQNIELIEGDALTLQFDLTYKDSEGVRQVFDLTGYTGLTLRCKNNPGQPDGDAFFTGAGSIIGAATNGQCEVVVVSPATDQPGRFHYALKGTKSAVTRTLAHGEWIIANV
jgi:hypothetical protein